MHEHILVVDDEKEIADLLEVYLKNDGYTVHKFYNGLDALQCCADSLAPEDTAFTEAQIDRFYQSVDALKANGI